MGCWGPPLSIGPRGAPRLGPGSAGWALSMVSWDTKGPQKLSWPWQGHPSCPRGLLQKNPWLDTGVVGYVASPAPF